MVLSRLMLSLAVALLAVACGAAPSPAPRPDAAPDAQPDAQRVFQPAASGVIHGIAYGPFREGQRPGGPDPTAAQIEQDLRIIARHWGMLRVYSSRGPTADILRIIREAKLPLTVVLGAWIAPDDAAANQAEVEQAIALARAYPDVVSAVSVGNETQVFWSGHRTPRDVLLGHLRTVRAAVQQPVTTADDYNFWNKPEAAPVAEAVDFILLHAYAMWNGRTLDDAVPWTERTVDAIRALHPTLPIVLGETGWATTLDPNGDEVQHIKAPAGEAEQARFHAEFKAWAAAREQPYFYCEAFDEPWKGSDSPLEVEKHWGLFDVQRKPKAAMAGDAP